MLALFNTSVFKTVFATGFTRAYLLIVELILVLVSANLLQPADRGTYVAGIGLLKTTAVLTTFSLGQIATHRIADARAEERRARAGFELANLFTGGMFFYGLAMVVFLSLGAISPSFSVTYVKPFHMLIAIGLPIYLFEAYLYMLLTSTGQLKSANLSIIVGKTANWALVLFSGYVLQNLSTELLIEYVVFSQFLVLVGYLLILQKHFRRFAIRVRFSIDSLFSSIRSAAKLYPTVIGSVVFSGIDMLLVYNYAGPASTSTYQIGLQGIAALSVLPFAIAQYGYSTITEHGVDFGWRRYRRILFAGLAAHVVFAAVSIPIAYSVEQLLFHGKYPDLIRIYTLLAIGSPGVYLSLTMAPMWITRGLFLVSSGLSLVTALVIIPTAILMLQHFGVIGAAFTFIAAQGVSIATNGTLIYYCEKNGK